MSDAIVDIHFRDMPVDEKLRAELQKRCAALAREFPELTHLELSLAPDGGGHAATGHASGKATQVASHASGAEPGPCAERLLDKLRQQLRRHHDKRIFSHRREAQQHHPRRTPQS